MAGFCGKCGAPISGPFCGKCGQPADAPRIPAPSQAAARPPAQPLGQTAAVAKKSSRLGKVLLIGRKEDRHFLSPKSTQERNKDYERQPILGKINRHVIPEKSPREILEQQPTQKEIHPVSPIIEDAHNYRSTDEAQPCVRQTSHIVVDHVLSQFVRCETAKTSVPKVISDRLPNWPEDRTDAILIVWRGAGSPDYY